MRFRLGAKYQLTEELKAEARLSTTSDGHDANNPHWDFGDGDGFNGADVALDRFYLDWMAMDELDVRAGKQPHAFKQPPIYGEFLWDNDIQPSGVAALWTPETDGDAKFDVRAAGYVATEVADDADPKMLGVQGNVVVPIEDELQVNGSVALYDWDDLEDGVTVAGNQGNTDVTSLSVTERLEWTRPHFLWAQFVNVINGTTDGEESANLFAAGVRGDWKPQGRLSLYALVNYDRNRFANIGRRFEEGLGLGYTAIDRPKHRLTAELGGQFVQQRNLDRVSDEFLAGRAAELYRYTFRESYPVDPSSAEYFDREDEAIEEAAERFAETLVTNLLEGF